VPRPESPCYDVSHGVRSVPLSIMFTDPPMAVIGHISKPNEKGHVLGCASYQDQGRARVFERNAGLIHLYADQISGRLTGATMVGPGIEHSAHLIAWAIQKGLTASEVLDLPFYHPTYEEGLKPALESICHDVHAPVPPNRDEGTLPGS
jgi:dihydrolipoamide dehydrogenase